MFTVLKGKYSIISPQFQGLIILKFRVTYNGLITSVTRPRQSLYRKNQTRNKRGISVQLICNLIVTSAVIILSMASDPSQTCLHPEARKDLRENACDPSGGKGGIAFHILTTLQKPIQLPKGTKKSRQGVVTLGVHSSSSIH